MDVPTLIIENLRFLLESSIDFRPKNRTLREDIVTIDLYFRFTIFLGFTFSVHFYICRIIKLYNDLDVVILVLKLIFQRKEMLSDLFKTV